MPPRKAGRAVVAAADASTAARSHGSTRAPGYVARRHAARRQTDKGKTAPRRRPTPSRPAPGKNQLPVLEQHTAELRGDLQALKTPADKAHTAIGKVKAPLLLPGQIKSKVKRVRTLAKGLDSLARLASIVPGPVGVGAKGLHRALVPLIGKRRSKGVFDKVIAALAKVERALKPVVTKLNKVERPIDAAREDLDDLLVHVGRLEAIAVGVRGHYGATPPDDVQACLGTLNDGLAPVVKTMRAARNRAAGPLAQLAEGLDRLRAALDPLNDVARDVEQALAKLESKAARDIAKALDKIARAVQPILDAWEWVIENTIGRLLKLLGINLGAIDRFFQSVTKVLNPFKGLQRRIDRVARDLKAGVARLPAVASLLRALDSLSSLERQLDRALRKALHGACRTLLLPTDAQVRASAKRAKTA